MAKITQKEKLIELLKKNWMSSFQMQQAVMSSSADREMRRLRENPPEGYEIQQRPKKMPKGYRPCLEYKLVEVEEE